MRDFAVRRLFAAPGGGYRLGPFAAPGGRYRLWNIAAPGGGLCFSVVADAIPVSPPAAAEKQAA